VRFAQEREAGEAMKGSPEGSRQQAILGAEASKSQSTRHPKWIGQNLRVRVDSTFPRTTVRTEVFPLISIGVI